MSDNDNDFEDFIDVEELGGDNNNNIEEDTNPKDNPEEVITRAQLDNNEEIDENIEKDENIINNNNNENIDNNEINEIGDNNENNNIEERNQDPEINNANEEEDIINQEPKKEEPKPVSKKKRAPKSNNLGGDISIHVHNPVPLSKLQIAENNYYRIKSELDAKYFRTPDIISELDPQSEAKQSKEMISYLEQLNDVLTQILKSTKITQKDKAKKKNLPKKTPEQIYQEQLKMNDNQEKIIEVYKKQLAALQNKMNQVSQDNFLVELKDKNKKLDEDIENLKIQNKKLNNEQKLNEIVISKQNKNEQEDRANLTLKKMNMDYSKIKNENEKLTKKIKEDKIKEKTKEIKL